MIGMILSTLPLERTVPALAEHTWVLVRGQGQTVEAIDLVGCEKGQRVLVLSGEAVQKTCMGCPAEHAVVAVLPEIVVDKSGEQRL